MEVLYKKRKTVEGKKIDFIFLEDNDFKDVMLGNHQEFIDEHQEGNVNIVVVAYPSFNSLFPAGIDYSVDFLRELYPQESDHV